MATLMPRGESWNSETASHFAMYDDQQNYFQSVAEVFEGLSRTRKRRGLLLRHRDGSFSGCRPSRINVARASCSRDVDCV